MIVGGYREVGGVRSFVEEAGEGRPVLCLHTAGQSGIQWRHVLEQLPEHGYRVIVPDLPGHGRSMPAPGGLVRDLGEYAEWCLELFDQLGSEQPPFLVGCSIGGKIALEIAVRAPQRLAGIVACACDAKNSVLGVGGLERSLQDAAAPGRTDRTEIGTMEAVGRDVELPRARLIAQLHRREDPFVTAADLIGWSSQDLRDSLGEASCPAVLVAGEDDFWIDAEDTRRAAEAMPDARFVLLPRIGHYPMEEMPDFSQRLAAWLGELGQEASDEL